MRIRCSKGLRISHFHGHFFIRSTDLLALPQVSDLRTWLLAEVECCWPFGGGGRGEGISPQT